MRPLSYTRAAGVAEAVATVGAEPGSAFLAGGTTEVDLIRLGVARPALLVDINDLPLAGVEDLPDGGIRIGALARMNDVARAPVVVERHPAVSQALLLGASEQLRNMASMGGNLCQRTRCSYFRDNVSPCNKREPGTGCSALDGLNRGHAILGTSEHCIATHPSDVAVALVAFDAVVHTIGRDGFRGGGRVARESTRSIPYDDFSLLPGDTPHLEHPLAPGELIAAIELPPAAIARGSLYLKLRDRQSYEFALVSVCAALRVQNGSGRGAQAGGGATVADVRLALGGVGTKPWRARRAEAELIGAPATPESFAAAAAAELSAAEVRRHNAFKVDLARRAIVRALNRVMAGGAR